MLAGVITGNSCPLRNNRDINDEALVYLGPAKKDLQERPKPEIEAHTDAIVKIVKSTICGTDLHILKGDVPSKPGRILGHEGAGIVEDVGAGVTAFKTGDL
ncbi:MAG: alcohol dehydrogenase catalytic domain-containing protein [Rhodomicrobium sp.]